MEFELEQTNSGINAAKKDIALGMGSESIHVFELLEKMIKEYKTVIGHVILAAKKMWAVNEITDGQAVMLALGPSKKLFKKIILANHEFKNLD